ncbi:MAG: ABC transporter substrate-binding protein [Limnochordia bacterium]|jgi:sn-glycerol 3-phosphate transport system substrate-binding protein
MLKPSKMLLLALILVLCLPSLALGAVKVEFWHSMTGSRLQVLENLVNEFNAINPDQQIEPILIGTYEEGLTRFMAAYPVGQEPGIVQVYEVGTQAMHDSGMIIPAYQIPERLGETWDFGQYIEPIVRYYSKDGNLWSWPFASSSAMMYYNADHFRQAGLDPDRPPRTWQEMYEMGRQLIEAGVVTHAMSTGWPDWMFETQLAMHDIEYANMGNGREGYPTAVTWPNQFTDELMEIWGKMAKDNVWIYGGAEYNANGAFTSGEITFLLQSTSSLDGILNTVGDDFEVRTTFLPRLSDKYPRGNVLIGGNSLYVSNRVSDEELRVIFEFFKFLSRTEVGVYWHKNTGYFPATNAALQALMDEGWFTQSPNHLTAFLQILSGKTHGNAASGMRMGPFAQAREWVRDALEKIARGEDQRAALEYSAQQINGLLAEYNEFLGE